MINLTDADSAIPSEHQIAYANRMLCQRVGLNEWRVVPKVAGKSFRLVRFVKRGQWKIECEDYKTGEPCPANSFGRLCAHSYRVLKQLRTNERRRRNRNQQIAA